MIQTKITKDIYHGDGTTRRFEVTFDYNTKNNVKQIDLYTCTYTTEEGVTKYNNDVTKITSNYDFEVVNDVTYAVYPSDAAVSDGATPMATGTAIIIMRNTPNEQLSTGQYTSEKVEKQLDRITMVAQELQEQIDRCPKAPKYAESISEADFTTVAQSIDSVNNVSDNISSVNTVATNIEDVKEVNDNIEDVKEAAEAVSVLEPYLVDISTVADNTTAINTVSSDIQAINTVSSNISDVGTVASNSTNIDTVSNNISNINTAATNMSAIIAAPTAAQNASTYATNAYNSAESAANSASQAATVLSSCADKSLSNLNTTGEAKFDAKVDLDGSNATFTHIVETYSNGADWYRVWSDGWCEQGGGGVTSAGNVNFLKPFINTNYCLIGSIGSGNSTTTYEHYNLEKTSTTYFYNNCCFDGYTLQSWYACGYIS